MQIASLSTVPNGMAGAAECEQIPHAVIMGVAPAYEMVDHQVINGVTVPTMVAVTLKCQASSLPPGLPAQPIPVIQCAPLIDYRQPSHQAGMATKAGCRRSTSCNLKRTAALLAGHLNPCRCDPGTGCATESTAVSTAHGFIRGQGRSIDSKGAPTPLTFKRRGGARLGSLSKLGRQHVGMEVARSRCGIAAMRAESSTASLDLGWSTVERCAAYHTKAIRANHNAAILRGHGV